MFLFSFIRCVKNDVPNAVKFPLDTTSPSCCNWNIIDDDAFACKNVNSLFLAFGSPLVSASNANMLNLASVKSSVSPVAVCD